MSEKLSEYEKMRAVNVQERMALLEKLNIMEDKEKLKTPKKIQTPAKRKLPKLKSNEDTPRRKSLRILGITSEVQENKVEPPVEYVDPYPRKPAGLLAMSYMCRAEEPEKETSEFISVMNSVEEPKGYGSQDDRNISKFMSSMKKLKLPIANVCKLVPDRIFSVTVHPTESKVLVCAGAKYGAIGIWDVGNGGAEEQTCYLFEPHSRAVNCLEFNPGDHRKLFSCSFDGTVRSADLEKQVFNEVYALPEEEDDYCSHLGFLSPYTLCVSQGDGSVGVLDTRTAGSGSEHSYQLHTRKLRTVSVHPLRKDYILTACITGDASVWDLRAAKKKDSSPVVNFPHKNGVTSAYFSPITGNSVLTTSTDDTVRVYDTTNLDGSAKIIQMIKHDNHVGRWLTNFRSAWHPQREDVFVVGSMSRPRQIEVFYNQGISYQPHGLRSDNLASVCSINAFHPTLDVLAGGNSSGRVHVFS